jgi:hypothetical protein
MSFLFDRRRKADGWFALLTSGLAAWHFGNLGLDHLVGSRLPGRLAPLTAPWICVSALGVAYCYFRLKPPRIEALGMLAAFALLAVSAATPNPIACLIVVVTQAALLLREHARELRALTVAAEDRLLTLQERNRDVNRLNEEVRLQIHDRSARLADALGRIGNLSDLESRGLTIGAVVGDRYRIIRRIAQGGMGAVYEVERTPDRKRFALKTLLVANSGTWLARLAREAQAVAAVVHPNVVGIVDIDVAVSGMPYLVMELVNGESLTAKKARFGDATFAREVVRQLAGGLAALHEVGIVHRDLTPANVLIEPQQGGQFRAKIVDFGIARLAIASDATMMERGPWETSGSLTHTGWVMGTPLYMAPELANGVKDASPSCDLWSLGVVAYQLGCGRLPFLDPPVHGTRDGAWQRPAIDTGVLTQPLRTVVERCLVVDPAERPTAAEVAAALS